MLEAQERFIRRLAPAVIELAARTGLPASVVLAQAALESNWGRSELARKHRNLFGLKARGSRYATSPTMGEPGKGGEAGAEDSVEYETTEYRNGQRRRERARFAHYRSYTECLEAYARVLALPRYKPARAVAGNPEAFARALQRCGYATDPRYAHKLGLIIRRHGLEVYDRGVVDGPWRGMTGRWRPEVEEVGRCGRRPRGRKQCGANLYQGGHR